MVKAIALAMLLATTPVVAVWSASPAQAQGQTQGQGLPDPLPRLKSEAKNLDVSLGSLVAVGLGAVAGSVMFNSVLGVPHMISAVAGGVLGYWVYQEYQDDIEERTLQLRVPGSFAMEHAPQNPAVTARWLGTVAQ